MKFIYTITGITLIALAIAGCNNPFAKAAECGDKDVVSLVKNIYVDMIKETANNPLTKIFTSNLPKSIVSLKSARSSKYDKEIYLRSCKAEAQLENGQKVNIEYTVQYLPEEKDTMVELSSDFLEPLMQQSIMNTFLKDKK